MLLNTEDNKFKYLIFNIIGSNVYFLYRKVNVSHSRIHRLYINNK
jgi:hypothetical protein